MCGALFDNTKLTAYFLWDHTGCDNALDLWYCAEDMACYCERKDILDTRQLNSILQLGVYDPGYIEFVRNIAFRIYVYTHNTDALRNWFAAERLLTISEWTHALTDMAAIYRREKANDTVMNEVRSENVRAYYDEQTFKPS